MANATDSTAEKLSQLALAAEDEEKTTVEQEKTAVEEKAVEEEEEDFTDPKTIRAPGNLNELVEQLHKVFAKDKINVDYVTALMESYVSNPRDWKKFAKFDSYRYTRNLVDEGNGKFNLMVLCWNEAQASTIHSHAGSHCFLKVLDGSVKEEMFDWPAHLLSSHQKTGWTDVEPKEASEMVATEEFLFYKDQCTYMCDDRGLHRVENGDHIDKAVTLHLYSPPFDQCLCFDQSTGKHVTSTVTFWSKFGTLTFGRESQPAEDSQQAEDPQREQEND